MSGVEDQGRPYSPAPREARGELFTSDGVQAVRLPGAFRFEGAEVRMRREGGRVILEPVKRTVLATPDDRAAFWARIDGMCDEPFPFPMSEYLTFREFDFDS